MAWLVWRQHRKQLLVGLATLAALGAFFYFTGKPMHDDFAAAGLSECLPQVIDRPIVNPVDDIVEVPGESEVKPGTDNFIQAANPDDSPEAIGRCIQAANDFFEGRHYVIFTGLLLLLLPMLVGMFWGAPLVAREIEHGTHRLVWTQGTSRIQWLTAKVGLVSLGVLVLTATYAWMLNWWISPVMQTSGQRFDFVFYDIHGIVVIGYTMFALALGVVAGAVTGRLLSAMAVTVLGFLSTWLTVMLLVRDRYLPLETVRLRLVEPGVGSQAWNLLHGDWIRSRGAVVSAPDCPVDLPDCYEVLTMHPARHFWTFQAIETAILMALALLLFLAAVRVVRRRAG
jgi:hypothetical protein